MGTSTKEKCDNGGRGKRSHGGRVLVDEGRDPQSNADNTDAANEKAKESESN